METFTSTQEIFRDATPQEKCSFCGESAESYPEGSKIRYDRQQDCFFHTSRGCNPKTCEHPDIDDDEYSRTCKFCDKTWSVSEID